MPNIGNKKEEIKLLKNVKDKILNMEISNNIKENIDKYYNICNKL